MSIVRENQRRLERENAKQSIVLTPVPKNLWPDLSAMKPPPSAVWRSREYLVQLFEEDAGVIRLSVNLTTTDRYGNWSDDITWNELQSIKYQVGFGDHYAIEVYPRDRDIVNVANMRHLWMMREPLNIGWVRS